MMKKTARRKARSPRSTKSAGPIVFIFGAGKVGSGLARALRDAGVTCSLRPQRSDLPARKINADIVVLAVRDRHIAEAAQALRERGLIGHRPVVVVHCAGALGPEVLAPARDPEGLVSVAQMHPMISFASKEITPSLDRGQLHVDGDSAAVRAASALGRRLGMSPRTVLGIDRVAYHAAAGLVANGAAALAAGGLDLLEKANVSRDVGAAMLGPLLRSVAENVEQLGMPSALTGPVRRGDVGGIKRHLETLREKSPHLVPFYVVASLLQVPLARALGEAEPASFDAIEAALTPLL